MFAFTVAAFDIQLSGSKNHRNCYDGRCQDHTSPPFFHLHCSRKHVNDMLNIVKWESNRFYVPALTSGVSQDKMINSR